jgi:hypothetical protein
MLTENQKNRLLALINKCEDESLKKLIEAAAKQWISGNVSPLRNDYGVTVENECYVSVNNHSCLISSAMIGEKSSCPNIPGPDLYHPRMVNLALSRDATQKFGISESKINQIIGVFDGESEYATYTGLIIKELYEILFL